MIWTYSTPQFIAVRVVATTHSPRSLQARSGPCGKPPELLKNGRGELGWNYRRRLLLGKFDQVARRSWAVDKLSDRVELRKRRAIAVRRFRFNGPKDDCAIVLALG
jgi:hypothetical protein